MMYDSQISIPKKDYLKIKAFCNLADDCKPEAYQKSDEPIVFTARFDDGKTVDIRCFGGGGEPSCVEIALYDKDDNELYVEEYTEDLLGVLIIDAPDQEDIYGLVVDVLYDIEVRVNDEWLPAQVTNEDFILISRFLNGVSSEKESDVKIKLRNKDIINVGSIDAIKIVK